jgi:hypothetical protein
MFIVKELFFNKTINYLLHAKRILGFRQLGFGVGRLERGARRSTEFHKEILQPLINGIQFT